MAFLIGAYGEEPVVRMPYACQQDSGYYEAWCAEVYGSRKVPSDAGESAGASRYEPPRKDQGGASFPVNTEWRGLFAPKQ